MNSIKLFVQRYSGLIFSAIILCVLIYIFYMISISKTEGHFVYAIDDPYIHMDVAKNIVKYGVWGITKYGFTALSSSIIWPLLLAGAYKMLGVNEILPLIMNVLSALALITLIYCILRKYTSNQLILSVILISFILLVPVIPPIFTGLEHTFHAFLSVLFMYLSSVILCKNEIQLRNCKMLFFTAPILMATRYEAMFLIAIIAFFFVLRKQWKIAVLLVVFSIIPIIIYGVISVAKGWYFFPNSVLIKGNMPKVSSLISIISVFGRHAIATTVKQSHLYVLMLISLLYLLCQIKRYPCIWRIDTIMMIIFILVMLLHLQFADTNWFTRYELYFISMGFTVIAVFALQDIANMNKPIWNITKIQQYIISCLILVFLFIPFEERGRLYLINIPKASSNIYCQQIQMAKFIKQYFQGACVAINDIGAVNWFADIKCLDLYGLANIEVANAKLKNNYSTAVIDSISLINDTKIAIVYDSWYYLYGGLPRNWVKVGQWKVLNNVVCGSDVVTFYAIDPSYADYLTKSFFEFSQKLPSGADYFLFNGQK